MDENSTTQTTEAARLDALAGPEDDASRALAARVKEWMGCPCERGRTCQWPRCAKTETGIGHYP